MTSEYRQHFGRILAVVTWMMVAAGLIAVLVDQGLAGILRHGSWLLLVAVLAWALFFNPRVQVDTAGVVIVNVFRTIALPWPAIQAVDTRWALTLDTAYGRYMAWAAPAPGRYASRNLTERDLQHLPDSSFGEGAAIRPGDSPRSPSGQAALAVRRQWEALRDAGYLDDPRLEFERAPVRWHAGTIAAIGVLCVWGLAALLG
jgi:hypothetical protein